MEVCVLVSPQTYQKGNGGLLGLLGLRTHARAHEGIFAMDAERTTLKSWRERLATPLQPAPPLKDAEEKIAGETSSANLTNLTNPDSLRVGLRTGESANLQQTPVPDVTSWPRYGLIAKQMPRNTNTVVAGERGAVILVPGPSLTARDDPRIPPEHWGRVWEYATNFGTVLTPFPTDDAPEFEEFKTWATKVQRELHPEYFCATCGWRRVGPNGACGPCLSNEQGAGF